VESWCVLNEVVEAFPFGWIFPLILPRDGTWHLLAGTCHPFKGTYLHLQVPMEGAKLKT
jgi:hypothetical protein